MSLTTTALDDIPVPSGRQADPGLAFRVRPIMRQGTASSIPEIWEHYRTLESARTAIKQAYRDDRVLRMFIVSDDVPPRFVEWVER